jgi:hypothetical protein
MFANHSLYGIPRVQSGLDFVQRWEAAVLLTGLVDGPRAHAILLACVRRLTQDRPSDLAPACNRLYELQQFLNAMAGADTGTKIPEVSIEALDEIFNRTKQLIAQTQPAVAKIAGTQTSPTPAPAVVYRQKGVHPRG